MYLNAWPNFEYGIEIYIPTLYILAVGSFTLPSFKSFCFKKSKTQSVHTSAIRQSAGEEGVKN